MLRYVERPEPDAMATLSLSKPTLDRIQLGQTTLAAAKAAGDLRIEGQEQALEHFFGLLDDYDFWFPIVTPRPAAGPIRAASR